MAAPTNVQTTGTGALSATLGPSATYTVGAGNNKRILVALHGWSSTSSTTNATTATLAHSTLGNLNLVSRIVSNNANGGASSTSILWLFDLPIGSTTPAGTFTATLSASMRTLMVAMTIADVSQATSAATIATSQSIGPDSVASTSTDVVVDFVSNDSQNTSTGYAITVGSGQTQLSNVRVFSATGNEGSLGSSYEAGGASTTSMGWTGNLSLGPRAHHIVAGYPAASSATLGVGASAGTTTLNGIPADYSVGSSAGVGAATGTAYARILGAGASAGLTTLAGFAAVTSVAVGSGAGQGSAAGVGISSALGVGASAGVSTVTATGFSLSTGTSGGVGSASGVGFGVTFKAGFATGSSTVAGFAAVTALSTGIAVGSAVTVGVGLDTELRAGIASGVGTVTGAGIALNLSIGLATGSATVIGRSRVLAVGTAVGTSSALGDSDIGGVVANRIYPAFLQSLLATYVGGAAGIASPIVKLYAVDPTYLFNESHSSLSDLKGILGSPATLQNMTYFGGILKADDLISTFVDAGDATIQALILVLEGAGGASQLIAYIDKGFTLSLPLRTGGYKINVFWDSIGILSV